MSNPNGSYVTFRAEIDFERVWPAIDPASLARLQARWTALEAERKAQERMARL